jgi:membrane fusion protein (multidrug efflux system)
VVSARYIKVGNAIQPNVQAFKITQMDTLHAHIYVPERDIQKLAPKQVATMSLDAWPEKTFFNGSILRVNPVVDAATGTVKVTVAMAGSQRELKPGMFGRIEIRYDRRDAATLVAQGRGADRGRRAIGVRGRRRQGQAPLDQDRVFRQLQLRSA